MFREHQRSGGVPGSELQRSRGCTNESTGPSPSIASRRSTPDDELLAFQTLDSGEGDGVAPAMVARRAAVMASAWEAVSMRSLSQPSQL